MHLSSSRPPRRRATGFTLIELLVTLVIVSVGILGIVKMEAAAVSESQVSRVRSLMTYQAESLAGAMRANRGYWAATGVTPPSFSFDGTTATPDVNAAGDCTTASGTAPCSAANMAAADLKVWLNAFKTAFPGATAAVACAGTCTAAATGPTSYDITLSWTEKTVAVNRSGANATTNLPVSMVLHVQP